MSNRNDYWAYLRPQSTDLKHHGVKGMKWRIRKGEDNSFSNIRRKKKNKQSGNARQISGTSEIWALGKMVVEAMLGGDEGAF